MSAIEGVDEILRAVGLAQTNAGASDGESWFGSGDEIEVTTPINGQVLARVRSASAADCERAVSAARTAFASWRQVPAPRRGELVRQLGDELRGKKDLLGHLVSLEMGKSLQEGCGEVQEMIDICDLAVGQSRMLCGVQTHSERPRHRMFEQWQPYGIVGIITAFNFPVAVWAWNAALALVCGDVCLWKPAPAVPLTAIACQKILLEVLKRNGLPAATSTLLCGGADVGQLLLEDRRLPVVSFTGSCKVGKHVAETVGRRLGKTILELGGNNAIIITRNADLQLAAENVLFGAVGTAGQRCTTTRRVIVEDRVYGEFKTLLLRYYDRVTIGNPLDEKNLMGPLVDQRAVARYLEAIATVKAQGGTFLIEGGRLGGDGHQGGCYVSPSVAEVPADLPIVQEETFGPLLYLIRYSGGLEEAVRIQNAVPQGLSSAIFTNNLLESEYFLGQLGSDCGIANVNLGTSGAEIGLAFGGEKDTGGGRESGSDAWKAYMRRQTCTVNWSGGTTLAQGIRFE